MSEKSSEDFSSLATDGESTHNDSSSSAVSDDMDVIDFAQPVEQKTLLEIKNESKITKSLKIVQDAVKTEMKKKTPKEYVVAIIQTSVLFYCYVGVGFLNSISGPLISHIQENVGCTDDQIGWILTTKGIGMVFGAPIVGFILNLVIKHDYEKHKWYTLTLNRMLLVQLLCMGISLFLVPFLKTYFLILLVHFFQGFFTGAIEVCCNLGIANIWRTQIQPFLQALHCASAVGSLLYPLIITQIFTFVKDFQMQLVISYVVCTGLVLIAVVPLAFVTSPKQPYNGKKKKKGKIKDRIMAIIKNPKETIVGISKEVFSINTLIYCFAGYLKGSFTGGYSVFGNLIFKFCQTKKLGSDIMLGYLTTAFWLSFSLGRFFSIFITIFMNPFVMTSNAVGVTLIAYALMIMFSENIYVIWIGVILHGLFSSPISALAMSLPQTSFGIKVNPISSSIVMFGSTLGEMISPTLVNLFHPIFQSNSLIYVLFVLFCTAAVDVALMYIIGKLYFWWKRKKNPEEFESDEDELKKMKNGDQARIMEYNLSPTDQNFANEAIRQYKSITSSRDSGTSSASEGE